MTNPSKSIFAKIIIFAVLMLEMATDLYAPSMPEMARYFGQDSNTIVLTISIYLLGFSLPGVIFGPLSDAIGRRPLFLLGAAIFCVGSFASWLSIDITMLITSRFIQGTGAGIFYVLYPAMIKDNFGEEQCSKIFSSIGMIVAMSPMVAPIIGAIVARYCGWVMNFAIISCSSLLILAISFTFLPESLQAQDRQPFSWTAVLKNYRQLLVDPTVIGYAIISGVTFGGLWGWIAAAPFFFINTYGLAPLDYSYFAAIGPFAYIMGTIFNQRFVERFGVDQMFSIALLIMTIGSASLFVVVRSFTVSPLIIYLPIIIYAFGLAPVFANATTRAVTVMPRQRGAASAILCTIETLAASAGAYIVSLFDNGTLNPATWVILISVIIGNGIYYLLRSRTKTQGMTTLP